MKTTLTLFLLLLSLPAYAADPLWQEMQGRWRGTVRVQESSCKVTKLSQKIDLRVRPRSETEETLAGRTAARRYVGYVLEPDTFDDGLLVQFYASKPYRMKNGRVCKLIQPALRSAANGAMSPPSLKAPLDAVLAKSYPGWVDRARPRKLSDFVGRQEPARPVNAYLCYYFAATEAILSMCPLGGGDTPTVLPPPRGSCSRSVF